MRAWYDAKLQREKRPETTSRSKPITTCIHCGSPFGYGEGYIFDEVSLCDVRDGGVGWPLADGLLRQNYRHQIG